MDLAGLWRQADAYLRLHMKSKAVKQAEERRLERQSREAGRRLKRAALVGGTSGAGLFGYGLLATPIAAPALLGAAAAVLAAAALFWPSRGAGADGGFSQGELAALPGRAEDWLLARRDTLPVDCRPQLDRLFLHLGDLQPHLGRLPPHATAAWEARRLLGDHLPRLILAYEELPASVRAGDPEVRSRLGAGLAAVADALDELCRDVCRNPLMTFETEGRFLETRYRSPGLQRD
jgi:hypothetical protein